MSLTSVVVTKDRLMSNQDGETITNRKNQRKKVGEITMDEVGKHNQETDAWIVVDNIVYDLTDFVDSHPGGTDILLDYLGQDITKALQDPSLHKHTSAAYSMLEQYAIGRVNSANSISPDSLSNSSFEGLNSFVSSKDQPLADFEKPLVHQVGMMGTDYFEWCHTDPVFFKEPVPLFGNAFLEITTHTPWHIVPCVWIPVSLILDALALKSGLSVAATLSTNLLGFLLWFVLEYNLHKYLFHFDTLGKMGFYVTNVLHFLLHGFHHKVPMDKDRLVVPVALFVLLSAPFVSIALTILPTAFAYSLIAGAFLGYVYYDMHHYWLHHAANAARAPQPFKTFFMTERWQVLKTHHFIHHFAIGGDETNYGISNRAIDYLLGTLRVGH